MLRDVTRQTGITFRHTDGLSGQRYIIETVSAGLVDFDNDGDIDVVILNSRREPTILRNDSAGNHWVHIRLRGVRANREGVGARVRVISGNLTQVAEVHSGRGCQGHYGTRLHFGLGNRQRVDRVEVRWPGGTVDEFTDLLADRFLTITEGSTKVRVTPRPAAVNGD